VGVAWLQDSVVEGGAPALLQPKLEAGRRQGARAVLLDPKVGLGDLPSTLATVAVVKVSGGAFWSSKGVAGHGVFLGQTPSVMQRDSTTNHVSNSCLNSKIFGWICTRG
jgi:hypothetical protein